MNANNVPGVASAQPIMNQFSNTPNANPRAQVAAQEQAMHGGQAAEEVFNAVAGRHEQNANNMQAEQLRAMQAGQAQTNEALKGLNTTLGQLGQHLAPQPQQAAAPDYTAFDLSPEESTAFAKSSGVIGKIAGRQAAEARHAMQEQFNAQLSALEQRFSDQMAQLSTSQQGMQQQQVNGYMDAVQNAAQQYQIDQSVVNSQEFTDALNQPVNAMLPLSASNSYAALYDDAVRNPTAEGAQFLTNFYANFRGQGQAQQPQQPQQPQQQPPPAPQPQQHFAQQPPQQFNSGQVRSNAAAPGGMQQPGGVEPVELMMAGSKVIVPNTSQAVQEMMTQHEQNLIRGDLNGATPDEVTSMTQALMSQLQKLRQAGL